jgi:NADH-quinone oxidoreductase subunit J
MIDLQQILFWIFSLTMVGAAALVITRDNLVNSAMLLIQVFLCMAGIFLLLQAFFLAIIQVLVYAGAVVVLFLFVIMLLQPDKERKTAFNSVANAGAVITFLALGAAALYVAFNTPSVEAPADLAVVQGDLRQVVQPIFSTYLLPFQLTALILLTGMIGVVVLSRKDSP